MWKASKPWAESPRFNWRREYLIRSREWRNSAWLVVLYFPPLCMRGEEKINGEDEVCGCVWRRL